MSRNRLRGPPTSRDNGLAANEETDMWNKIIQDLRKAKEKNDKQRALSEQIASLNEKIAREGNSKYIVACCILHIHYLCCCHVPVFDLILDFVSLLHSLDGRALRMSVQLVFYSSL